jgi:hypothetical protein
MWKELKFWLWRLIPWWETCPICGSGMLKQGFPENARYVCLNEKCEFNKQG